METNLKFNSSVCTSREQSERLLALGLNTETADMGLIGDIPVILPTTWSNTDPLFDTPAWSLHRLIEIYDKTCIFWSDCFDNPYEAMISRIANKIKWGELNKEYLEE